MERRNRATDEGRELGTHLARLCDEAEPRARLKAPTILPRCASCAFRAGSHLANGSPETLMDAIKCSMEGVLFHCHDVHRDGDICSGWLMLHLGSEGEPREAPWPWMQRAEHNDGEPHPEGGAGTREGEGTRGEDGEDERG